MSGDLVQTMTLRLWWSGSGDFRGLGQNPRFLPLIILIFI